MFVDILYQLCLQCRIQGMQIIIRLSASRKWVFRSYTLSQFAAVVYNIHTAQCFSFPAQARSIGCSNSRFFPGHISGPELTSCDYLSTVHSNTTCMYVCTYIYKQSSHTYTHTHTPLLHQPCNYTSTLTGECVNTTYASVRVYELECVCIRGRFFPRGSFPHLRARWIWRVRVAQPFVIR